MFNRFLTAVLRVFFHLLYHQMSFTYDLVAWAVSLGMWKAWVQCAAREVTGPRVLELGHGPGHLQIHLLASGISTFGLDVSTQMGRQAKKRITARGYDHNLVNAGSQQLPFPGNFFHQIVATFPTEYILLQNSIAEIYRVLMPGGNLIIVPVAWITGKSILQRAAAALFRITGQAREWDDEYLEPFKKAGFRVEIKRNKVRDSIVLILRASKPK
jgi:ubiquinone/menaquinone biosynthesis C-methylase UbiE